MALQGLLGRCSALGLLCCACGVLWGAPQEAATKPASAAKSAATSAGTSAATPKAASYALIFGTVWDSEGHPIYGVHTQLRRSGEKKIRWEAYSDHHGEFAFRVPPGQADYELVADQRSIKSLKNNSLTHAEPVKIHVEFDERVDTGLHLMK